jgi:hypothetical protein
MKPARFGNRVILPESRGGAGEGCNVTGREIFIVNMALPPRRAILTAFHCHPLGASQNRPVEEAVKLPVVWIPEANAELREARARYDTVRPGRWPAGTH